MNLENRWVFGLVAILGAGMWLALGGGSTIARQMSTPVVSRSNVKALKSVELDIPGNKIQDRLVTQTLSTPRSSGLSHRQFVRGDLLPTGFIRMRTGRTTLEDMLFDLQETIGRNSGLDACFFAHRQEVVEELSEIEADARKLELYASESEVADYIDRQFVALDTFPYIMVANAPSPAGLTVSDFSKVRDVIRSDSENIMNRVKGKAADKVRSSLEEWAEVDGLEVEMDFSKPKVLSEGRSHITLLMNMKMYMVMGSDTETAAVTVMATALNIGGRIVYAYAYTEQGNRQQLTQMAEWIDSIVERI